MKIHDGKYIVSSDDSIEVRIEAKDKGFIESQSVDSILLFEIVRLLTKILDEQERQGLI